MALVHDATNARSRAKLGAVLASTSTVAGDMPVGGTCLAAPRRHDASAVITASAAKNVGLDASPAAACWQTKQPLRGRRP